jgi:predicted branched-subunit amino acid permease
MEVDLFVIGALAFVAAAAFLILFMPKFNERLAFLTAMCGGAAAIIFVLQALR